MSDSSSSRSGGVLGKLFSSTANNDFALPSSLNKVAPDRPSPASLRPSFPTTPREHSSSTGPPRSAGSTSAATSMVLNQSQTPSAYAAFSGPGRPPADRRGSEPVLHAASSESLPSPGASPIGPPRRPPKPDALRIKKPKAKALSISLLSGSSPSTGPREGSSSTPATPYGAVPPRTSTDLLGLPQPAAARNGFNVSVLPGPKSAGHRRPSPRVEQAAFPQRSHSALGYNDAQEEEMIDEEPGVGRKRKSSARLLNVLPSRAGASSKALVYDDVHIISRFTAPSEGAGIAPPRTSSSSIRDQQIAGPQPPPPPNTKARPPNLPDRLPNAAESTFLDSVADPSVSRPSVETTGWEQRETGNDHLAQQRSRSREGRASPPQQTEQLTAVCPPPQPRRKFSMSSLLEAAPRSIASARSGAEGVNTAAYAAFPSAALSQARLRPAAQHDGGSNASGIPYATGGAPASAKNKRRLPGADGPVVDSKERASASLLMTDSGHPQGLNRNRQPSISPGAQRTPAQSGSNITSAAMPASRKASALAGLSSKFMRSTDRLADGGDDRNIAPSPTLMAPPPRHKLAKSYTREQTGGGQNSRKGDWEPLAASQGGGVAHTIGQIGAAVGKKGLGMMRSWNSSQQGTPVSTPELPSQLSASSALQYVDNEATRRWNNASDPDVALPSKGSSARLATAMQGGVFAVPLRDAVLRTRLLDAETGASVNPTLRSNPSTTPRPLTQLEDLDLGLDFSVPMPASSSDSMIERRSSRFVGSPNLSASPSAAASQAEARRRYMPAVVVRCLESLERWGSDEEGIYRISGRSSHTTKLRLIFDRPGGDLELQDIGPADLDLNSVSSLLKHYLRELPESLLTQKLARSFDEAAVNATGSCATSGNASGGPGGLAISMFGASSVDRPHGAMHPDQHSLAMAEAVAPIMPCLPVCNWYLLRDITHHLSKLCQPEVVARTKMPLNNLGLVLAPTLGLSVGMMRALIQHHAIVFSAGGPTEIDEQLGAPESSAVTLTRAAEGHRSEDHLLRVDASKRGVRPSTSPGFEPEVAPGLLTVSRSSDAIDKRDSNSSVATLRAALENMSPRTAQRPQALEDDPDITAAPIAARFTRSRAASNASALTSFTSGWSVAELPPSPMLTHQRLDSNGSSVEVGKQPGSTSSQLVSQVSPSPSSSFSTGTGAHVPAAWESSSNSSSSRRTSEDGEMGDGYRKGSNTGPASHTSHASSIDRPRPLTSGNNRFFANKNGQKVAPIVTRFRSQTTASPQVTSPRRLPPLQPTGLSVSHSSPNNGPSSLPDSGPGLSMRQDLGHSSTAIAGRSDPAQDASPATPLAALP